MSDTVHYIPGDAPMLNWDEKRIRLIPCGIGKKKYRDLTAATMRKDVTCSRCIASFYYTKVDAG